MASDHEEDHSVLYTMLESVDSWGEEEAEEGGSPSEGKKGLGVGGVGGEETSGKIEEKRGEEGGREGMGGDRVGERGKGVERREEGKGRGTFGEGDISVGIWEQSVVETRVGGREEGGEVEGVGRGEEVEEKREDLERLLPLGGGNDVDRLRNAISSLQVALEGEKLQHMFWKCQVASLERTQEMRAIEMEQVSARLKEERERSGMLSHFLVQYGGVDVMEELETVGKARVGGVGGKEGEKGGGEEKRVVEKVVSEAPALEFLRGEALHASKQRIRELEKKIGEMGRELEKTRLEQEGERAGWKGQRKGLEEEVKRLNMALTQAGVVREGLEGDLKELKLAGEGWMEEKKKLEEDVGVRVGGLRRLEEEVREERRVRKEREGKLKMAEDALRILHRQKASLTEECERWKERVREAERRVEVVRSGSVGAGDGVGGEVVRGVVVEKGGEEWERVEGELKVVRVEKEELRQEVEGLRRVLEERRAEDGELEVVKRLKVVEGEAEELRGRVWEAERKEEERNGVVETLEKKVEELEDELERWREEGSRRVEAEEERDSAVKEMEKWKSEAERAVTVAREQESHAKAMKAALMSLEAAQGSRSHSKMIEMQETLEQLEREKESLEEQVERWKVRERGEEEKRERRKVVEVQTDAKETGEIGMQTEEEASREERSVQTHTIPTMTTETQTTPPPPTITTDTQTTLPPTTATTETQTTPPHPTTSIPTQTSPPATTSTETQTSPPSPLSLPPTIERKRGEGDGGGEVGEEEGGGGEEGGEEGEGGEGVEEEVEVGDSIIHHPPLPPSTPPRHPNSSQHSSPGSVASELSTVRGRKAEERAVVLERELGEKVRKVGVLGKKVKALEHSLAGAKRHVKELEGRQREWDALHAQLRREVREEKRKREIGEEELESRKARMEKMKGVMEKMRGKITALQQELEEVEKGKEEVEVEKERVEDELQQAKEHTDHLQAILNQHVSEEERLQRHIDSLEGERKGSEDGEGKGVSEVLREMEGELMTLREQVGQRDRVLAMATRKAVEEKRRREEVELRLQQLEEEKDSGGEEGVEEEDGDHVEEEQPASSPIGGSGGGSSEDELEVLRSACARQGEEVVRLRGELGRVVGELGRLRAVDVEGLQRQLSEAQGAAMTWERAARSALEQAQALSERRVALEKALRVAKRDQGALQGVRRERDALQAKVEELKVEVETAKRAAADAKRELGLVQTSLRLARIRGGLEREEKEESGRRFEEVEVEEESEEADEDELRATERLLDQVLGLDEEREDKRGESGRRRWRSESKKEPSHSHHHTSASPPFSRSLPTHPSTPPVRHGGGAHIYRPEVLASASGRLRPSTATPQRHTTKHIPSSAPPSRRLRQQIPTTSSSSSSSSSSFSSSPTLLPSPPRLRRSHSPPPPPPPAHMEEETVGTQTPARWSAPPSGGVGSGEGLTVERGSRWSWEKPHDVPLERSSWTDPKSAPMDKSKRHLWIQQKRAWEDIEQSLDSGVDEWTPLPKRKE